MATKKMNKTATTRAPKATQPEATTDVINEPMSAPTKRLKAEVKAAHARAEAKGREIEQRLASAKSKAEAKPKPSKKADTKPKKLSAIDAAAKLLAETGEPMTCRAMIEAMAARGLWTSPAGQTPHATLYSAITREITTKGDAARFRKTDRGQFAAN